MRRTITLSLALLAALAPATASAASHRYTSSFGLSTLSSGDGYPDAGGFSVLTGTWHVDGLGADRTGKLLDHVTITGHPVGNVFTYVAAETAILPGGTLNNVATGWSMVNPDGTLSLAGEGTFVGGTGRYRNAHGRFRFTGTGSPVDGTSTMQSRGKIVF
jgi:hypothetical protein